MIRLPYLVIPAALAAVFSFTAFARQSADGKIWSGVYTDAQAARGKANFTISCERCHGADLNGGAASAAGNAPSLKGARFTTVWDTKTVYDLFTKIRDTMPPNFGTILSDAAKLDVLVYILQSNGFPAGSAELKVDAELLEGVQIVRKGVTRPTNIPNFAVVQVVGCLTQTADKAWVLAQTSSPAPTRDQPSTPEQLKTASTQPLGSERFRLVSVSRFKPELHKGQKVEAKGLLYRDPGENRLNLTALETVAPDCPAR